MVLTVAECLAHIDHAAFGPLPIANGVSLVNRAGELLTTFYRWRWLERPAAFLSTRGQVSFVNGTWTAATKSLTSVGAFATYTWVDGDTIDVLSGTGVTTLGVHRVASKVDNDTITLVTSIAVGDLVAADISADSKFGFAACAVPSDFGEHIDIDATEGPTGSVRVVSPGEILRARARSVLDTGQHYLAAYDFVAPTTLGAPIQRLELYPAPSTTDVRQFMLWYRAAWSPVSADADNLPIPLYCELLMLRFLRELALGWKRDGDVSSSERLEIVRLGPEFRAAKARDGVGQRVYGPIGDGHAAEYGTSQRGWYTTLGGPT